MSESPSLPTILPPAGPLQPAREAFPAMLIPLGPGVRFAWDEFFYAQVRNPHTRKAYQHAVKRFLAWMDENERDLRNVDPGLVGSYFDQHPGSVPTKKVDLAALRAFFNVLVNRHVLLLNPAATVRGERYQVVEGKTPEISAAQARQLLAAIDNSTVVGLRDRAIIATLIFTAARAGAVARLRIRDLRDDGTQYLLRFLEKGGKAREIPVRRDLQVMLMRYLEQAGLTDAPKDSPLFRSALGRKDALFDRPLSGVDVCRLVKRRLAAAGLPDGISPHSFRVATVTDLLTQGISLEEVQYLAGHADPRTTRLYDRRQKRVTRNLVERISILPALEE